MKYVVTLALAVAILGIAPAGVAAGEYPCGECQERFNPWPLYEHKIPDSEDAAEDCGPWGCHNNYTSNSCEAYGHWHFDCEVIGGFALLEVQERMQGGPQATLVALAETELTLRPAATGGGVYVMRCDGKTPAAFIALSEETVGWLMALRSKSLTPFNSSSISVAATP